MPLKEEAVRNQKLCNHSLLLFFKWCVINDVLSCVQCAVISFFHTILLNQKCGNTCEKKLLYQYISKVCQKQQS